MEHKGTTELITRRLLLRRFTVDDAEEMFDSWASDSEVTRYLSWAAHENTEATKQYLTSVCENYADPSNYSWCICDRQSGELLGSIGAINPVEPLSSIGLGWCLKRAAWGRGIMPEAARAVVKFLFDEVKANRIEAIHHALNPKSGRVMQKIGMTFEGILRQYALDNLGNTVDVCLYSVTLRDYENNPSLTEKTPAPVRPILP